MKMEKEEYQKFIRGLNKELTVKKHGLDGEIERKKVKEKSAA